MLRKESYIRRQNKRHMQQIRGIDTPHSGRLAGATGDGDADAARYYVFVDQVLQRGVVDGLEEFLTDDFIEHEIGGDHPRDEFVSRILHQRAQFPDAVWTIELLAGVNGLVVCHATMAGSNLPALTTSAWENIVVRFEAGRMAECWRMRDETLLMNANQART